MRRLHVLRAQDAVFTSLFLSCFLMPSPTTAACLCFVPRTPSRYGVAAEGVHIIRPLHSRRVACVPHVIFLLSRISFFSIDTFLIDIVLTKPKGCFLPNYMFHRTTQLTYTSLAAFLTGDNAYPALAWNDQQNTHNEFERGFISPALDSNPADAVPKNL